MGGRIFAWLTLALVGVIIADVITHPKGVQAAGNQANRALRTTYTYVAGQG